MGIGIPTPPSFGTANGGVPVAYLVLLIGMGFRT